MSFSNTTEQAIMLLVYNATAWANYADNASSSPETNIHCALHTASPTDTGTMSSNETSYGAYARQNVARSGSGWTVSSGVATLAATLSFPECTSGTATITFGSTGKTGGGAAAILNYGGISPSIAVATAVIPQWTTSSTITLD